MPKRFPTADSEIFTYADGMHYVRVGDRERSLRTKDFKVAVKRKSGVLAKLELSGERAGRLKVGDVWQDYVDFRDPSRTESLRTLIAGRKRKTISKGTFEEIEDLWRLHLKSFFENVRLTVLFDDEKWNAYTEQSVVVDLANHRKVWRGFLKWCKSKKYIRSVPDLSIPAVERRERRVLKPHEIRKLFEHARGSVLLFVSMYLFMGMRRKEIMTLRWSSLFMEERYLVLLKSDVKTRKGRPLPINDFVFELLKARVLEQAKKRIHTDFVFPHRSKRSRHGDLSGLKTAWNNIMRKCGFEAGYITPHDLRATFEAYAHKSTDFTDTQREKFAGAAIDVQKKTYVRFDADDIRGLESVVQVAGLEQILKRKLQRGNDGEIKNEITTH